MAVAVTILVGGCQSTPKNNEKAKYVFLFIGDGMGTNQTYLAELYKATLKGNIGHEKLNLSTLPVQSYMTTYSASNYITCSSAAATAMATGYKTSNGLLGKDPSLKINYETVAEKAKKADYKIGILSSVAIDHATPAGFYAHQDSRNMYYEISLDLPQSGFDYFGGGGYHYPTGKTGDQADAYEIAKEQGYVVSNTLEAYEALTPANTKVISINPETYPKGEFYWEIDRKEGSISLADFTQQAIDQIYNEKGFFMMVEGGKIDWACHANDAASSIYETLAFDDAVAVALEFYKQHPHETLVIVTADHETGGMGTGTNENDDLGGLRIDLLAHQKISAQEFTRLLSEMEAQEKLMPFNQVMDTVTAYFGLNGAEKLLQLSAQETAWLKGAYLNEFTKGEAVDADADYLATSSELSLTERVIFLLNDKAGVGWTTSHHTATPVPVRAMGPGQDLFKESIDNTDLPKIISKVMGL